MSRAGAALARLVPPTPLSRRLAFQSVLYKIADGTFTTGSAVFFTQVTGLSIAQVGLGLTLGGVAQGIVALPVGRLVDRIGPKRAWSAGAFLAGTEFLAWPFLSGFAAYAIMVATFSMIGSLAWTGQAAYSLDVLPEEERVTTQAYVYSAMNLGSTLGALIGGVALAFDDLALIRWLPLLPAAIALTNATFVARLPRAPHDLAVAAGATRERPPGRGAIKNRGWLLLSACTGTMWTNQVLLSVLIPLWLVQETDSPHWLLAWLFGTNTVLCIVLPAYTSQGVHTISDALRRVRWSAAFFVASCLITMITHSTTGMVTALLVWLGHLTVTGAELAIGSAGWTYQSKLMDPRRRGEYDSVAGLFRGLGSEWAPALYTWLAISWRHAGWLVIGAIVIVAAGLSHPAARAAERFLEEELGQDATLTQGTVS